MYALRAASRLDANREWGKLGDEIISHLEQAYLAVLGPDAAKGVEVGRELLQTQHKPEASLHVADTTDHAQVISNLKRASAQARIAGQRWCCEAAISEIAMHSSGQKPAQLNERYSILRDADDRTALTQQASSVTARFARDGPSKRLYSFQPFSQQEISPVS